MQINARVIVSDALASKCAISVVEELLAEAKASMTAIDYQSDWVGSSGYLDGLVQCELDLPLEKDDFSWSQDRHGNPILILGLGNDTQLALTQCHLDRHSYLFFSAPYVLDEVNQIAFWSRYLIELHSRFGLSQAHAA